MNVNIGKSVLYQMLGVQSNHFSLKDNMKLSGECKECPWVLSALSNPSSTNIKLLHQRCSGCPFKGHCPDIYNISLEYINEKNKYGSKKKVCRNAILLFIVLHTFNPSKNGFINSVSVHTLSSILGVNTRTIQNCITILSKENYVYADKISPGYFNFILLDYPTYFLKANKGGRGFIKLSKDVIESLLSIKSLLAFRLIMRELLDSDYAKNQEKSYKELRLSLPAYCKRNVIIDKLQNYCSTIYNITLNTNLVSFVLKKENDSQLLYNNEIAQHEAYFSNLIESIDNFALSYNIGVDIPDKLHRFLMDEDGKVYTPVLFQLNGSSDITTVLAKLSCKYSKEIVTDALADTYRLHMCCNKGLIKNIGAYILEVIKSYGILDGLITRIDFSHIDNNSNLVVA